MASDQAGLRRAEINIRSRVECEQKAFHIINKLIDGYVDGQYLSECGKRISQVNYDDIVEERAISKLCGYPICDQNLPDVPKKKYHISTKSNKVYDISERKNFCSNQCFKASKCFRQQIPESPAWARDVEKINIVVSSHKEVPGLVGEEVIGERPKLILMKELEKLEELESKCVEKTIYGEESSSPKEIDDNKETASVRFEANNSAHASITDQECKESCKTEPVVIDHSSFVEDLQRNFEELNIETIKTRESLSPKQDTVKPASKYKKSREQRSTANEEIKTQSQSKLQQLQRLMSQRKNVLSGMVDLQESTNAIRDNQQETSDASKFSETSASKKMPQHEDKIDIPSERRVKKHLPSISLLSPLQLICQVLKKWVSVGTVEYLHFKTSSSESMVPVTKRFSDLQIQVDCVNLSHSLDQQEKQLDGLLQEGTTRLSENEDTHKDMKNVPDYTVLKEEAEQFQLKVTEFITGKQPKDTSKAKKDEPEDAIYIPTVDAYDQSQIRAKIVLEKLDKYLPDLLAPMRLSVQDVSTLIRELVYTFRLERDTIIFKPAEWALVSLILLKMLSFKVKHVNEAFHRNSTIQHFAVLLKGIKHTTEDLNLYTREVLSDATVSFDPS